MIRTVNLEHNNERIINAKELQTEVLHNIWLELVDPTAEEIQAISDKTEIPTRFLHIPEAEGKINLRLEQDFTVINFIILKSIVTTKETHPIVMIFTKNFLVTVIKKSDQSIIDVAKQRMSKPNVDPPAEVAYFIMDEIISDHFIHLEKIEEFTSNLEEEVVGQTAHSTLRKILKLKSRLISLNKILWYERGIIFKLKTAGDSSISARVRVMFDSTHDDLTRQIDIVETYREILSDSINVHLSAVSNKINFSIQSLTVVIFYLTIITTITSFPNTIATFFGISQFGNTNIVIILVAIVLSTILPLLWLWKKKWIKYPQPNTNNI